MKDQMAADRQRNWSEDGKTGRLFVLFVSLILSSYVRHVWKSTGLRKKFASSLEILDEYAPSAVSSTLKGRVSSRLSSGGSSKSARPLASLHRRTAGRTASPGR